MDELVLCSEYLHYFSEKDLNDLQLDFYEELLYKLFD
jgi:hypothetical protein